MVGAESTARLPPAVKFARLVLMDINWKVAGVRAGGGGGERTPLRDGPSALYEYLTIEQTIPWRLPTRAHVVQRVATSNDDSTSRLFLWDARPGGRVSRLRNKGGPPWISTESP